MSPAHDEPNMECVNVQWQGCSLDSSDSLYSLDLVIVLAVGCLVIPYS